MTSNVKYAVSLKNYQQNGITSQVGANGLIRFYNGAQATNPDTAVTSQLMLAELACSATLAPAAAAGVLTLSAISNGTGTAAAGTGTAATWFRLCKSDGTPIVDGTAGTTGCDLNINNTSIAQNQTVSVTGGTLTNPN